MRGVVISLPLPRLFCAKNCEKQMQTPYSNVGADAPSARWKCEFAVGYRKTGAFCRADVGIGPTHAYEFAEGLLVCCCMLATLRRFAPASLYQSSISSVPPTTATRPAADFFRQLFVEHEPREQNRHQNAQLIDGRDDARRAVLQGLY